LPRREELNMQNTFLRLVIVAFMALFLVACAEKNPDRSTQISEPIGIRLVIPSDENNEEFWDGVEIRDFLWFPSNGAEALRLPLTGGGEGVDFSTGGELRFEGKSASGVLLVTGRAAFSSWDPAQVPERLILITLHRR
jgi:hypothetical protein